MAYVEEQAGRAPAARDSEQLLRMHAAMTGGGGGGDADDVADLRSSLLPRLAAAVRLFARQVVTPPAGDLARGFGASRVAYTLYIVRAQVRALPRRGAGRSRG